MSGPNEHTDGAPVGLPATDLLRGIGALALLTAGIIHFAYAPAHLDENFSHGLFFLVVGWSQLALAAGLALRARPPRAWLAAAALGSLAVMGVWAVSRTIGTPGSEAEPVGFPDATATALEAVVVLVALVLLLDLVAARPIPRGPGRGIAVASAVATVVLVSASLSPSVAGEHHHETDAHGTHAEPSTTDAGWAESRLEALEGYMPTEDFEAFKQLAWDDVAHDVRTRSVELRALPESEREARIARYLDWAVDNTLAISGESQATGASGGEMHTHGPTEWQPVTDPRDQITLREQLRQSATPIERFPTVADAEAAGYFQITPYVPGIAAHYTNSAFDDRFDPAEPEMLLYNGSDPDSEIVGLTYVVLGPDEAPEGFATVNDIWHSHRALCVVEGFVVGVDGTPRDLCEGIGGNLEASIQLWMLHLWQVPGWESPWGLFSAENPAVNPTTSDLWAHRSRAG